MNTPTGREGATIRLLRVDENGGTYLEDTPPFGHEERPQYAVLSHTWEKGVMAQELGENVMMEERNAYKRDVQAGREKAEEVNANCWAWFDTCCIDQRGSSAMHDAINSMYRWYKKANVCYSYLRDLVGTDTMESLPEHEDRGLAVLFDFGTPHSNSSLSVSYNTWLSRGWASQESIVRPRLTFALDVFGGTSTATTRGRATNVRDERGIEFSQRLGNDRELFWIERKSGSGKSSLIKMLNQDLNRQDEGGTRRVVEHLKRLTSLFEEDMENHEHNEGDLQYRKGEWKTGGQSRPSHLRWQLWQSSRRRPWSLGRTAAMLAVPPSLLLINNFIQKQHPRSPTSLELVATDGTQDLAKILLGFQTRWFHDPSPTVFVLAVIAAGLMLTAYHRTLRGRRLQRYFLIGGIALWLLLWIVRRDDVVLSLLILLSWSLFGAFLCSDIVHWAALSGRYSPGQLVIICHHGSEEGEGGADVEVHKS